MRHEVKAIGGIPAESVPDMVEQAPGVHLTEGRFRHFQSLPIPVLFILLHQEQEIVRRGEFWGLSKSAEGCVEILLVPLNGVVDQGFVRLGGGGLVPV